MPVHTVYAAADAFERDSARRLVDEAEEYFCATFPTAEHLARASDPHACLADVVLADVDLWSDVHRRVRHRLTGTAMALAEGGVVDSVVQDLRIDFEDGYGPRSDAAEDRDAERAAGEAAAAFRAGRLPLGFGLRVRSTAPETASRCLRTLDLFVPALRAGLGSTWPPELLDGFVVTLAKISAPEEVAALAEALTAREPGWGLEPGSLGLELMAETPTSILDADGRVAAPAMVRAAGGRCRGIHLGVYDYTASLGVVAALQGQRHPSCDLARGLLQVSLAGLGGELHLSDGSSPVLPPTGDLEAAGRVLADMNHALERAIYRGWDMCAAHVALRWVAVTAFYRRYLAEMRSRCPAGSAVAGAPGRPGTRLEDAATFQALCGFFRRGTACGAIGPDEVPESMMDALA